MDFNGDGSIDLTDLTRASSYYPIVRNYYYSPFGEIWQGEVSSDTNPFRYCGEYCDSETGNIYLRARYYDPTIGRFITVDPIKDGTNWYVYCSNNPIAFVDPSGLTIKLPDDATEEQIQEYERAIEYLKTSEDGKALIEKLEDPDVIVYVKFNKTNSYKPDEDTIYWNPNAGHILSNNLVQSASVCLAHEMGHAAQDIDGELVGDTTTFENNNISKYEAPIAEQLGEPIRNNYFDTAYAVCDTPNSTEYGRAFKVFSPEWYDIFIGFKRYDWNFVEKKHRGVTR